MGFLDNYRSRLAKTLENQAKDKSKDPAERPSKKAAPKKDGLAEQLAMQQAKYSTSKNRASQPPPSAVYERNKASAEARKNAAPTSVTPTSRPKAADSLEVAVTARKRPPVIDEISMGTSPTPKAARPVSGRSAPTPAPRAFQAPKAAENPRDHREPTPAPKPRNYSTEAADKLKKLGLGEDNAVMDRLRKRAKMSQEERDKPFGEDNEVLKKLRAAGYKFAKGGKINGRAVKGKTKGRYI
jgi:hypothetical protein